MKRLALLLLVIGLGEHGYAQDGAVPLQASYDRLLLGSCMLSRDPAGEGANQQWPLLCVRGQAAAEALTRSERHEWDATQQSTSLYVGGHLLSGLSLHGKWSYRKLNTPFPAIQKDTDEAFLQVGNSATNRYRVMLGRFDLPFGIKRQETLNIIQQRYKNLSFWESGPYAARLTVEDLTVIQLDVGVGLEDYRRQRAQSVGASAADTPQIATRLMVDIAALGGTRFVFSHLEHGHFERRIGAGIIARDPGGGSSVFEWLRRFDLSRPTAKTFEQLLRLTYSGDDKMPRRWIFEYEDELRKHWLTTLGWEYTSDYKVRLRLHGGYFRSRYVGDVNHWFLGSGLQVVL